MPQIKNPRHEQIAQDVARGKSKSQAWIDAGYKHRNLASKLTATPEFNARVQEIRAEIDARTADVTVHTRHFIDERLGQVLDRCMQNTPVYDKRGNRVERECDTCGGMIGEYTFDAKNAISALHLLGLEQGMFKRSLDITSRKGKMIEGSQKEILGKFAELLNTLGVGAISQLLNLLGHDHIVAAMNLIGYEVAKANGKDVERLDGSEGRPADGGGLGESDPHAVRAESEAAAVS